MSAGPNAGLLAIVTRRGSLSYGKPASERMNDPEEEHDCFIDNTHNSHCHHGLDIRNVYLGSYPREGGSVTSGMSIAQLVAAADPTNDAETKAELDAAVAALFKVWATAEGGVAETVSVDRAVNALSLSKITFEGSDGLDSPNVVVQ